MSFRDITIDEWESRYNPLQDEDGLEIFYSPFRNKDCDEADLNFETLEEDAEAFAVSNGGSWYHYVWSRQEDDNGRLVLTNGVHTVNRLDYCLTHNSWASRAMDEDIDILVRYEED